MTELSRGEFIIEVDFADEDFASGRVFWPGGEVMMSEDGICPAQALIDRREWSSSQGLKVRPGMRVAGFLSRAREGSSFDYFGNHCRMLRAS